VRKQTELNGQNSWATLEVNIRGENYVRAKQLVSLKTGCYCN